MTCEVTHGATGAICELEYGHAGKHRRSNCDARKTVEWDDSEIAVSPWNRPLDPVIVKKSE